MKFDISALQTITTKYHGPTDTKGSRISATTTGGKRKFYAWDHALNVDQNHIKAAMCMAIDLGWDFGQSYIGGPTETGYVFVANNDKEEN
jgi:hypothetical protein